MQRRSLWVPLVAPLTPLHSAGAPFRSVRGSDKSRPALHRPLTIASEREKISLPPPHADCTVGWRLYDVPIPRPAGPPPARDPDVPLGPRATLMGITLETSSSDPESIRHWKLDDAFETYGVRNWGKGYFGINKRGPRHRPPEQEPRPGHRPQGPGRPAPAPRHPAADPAPLHRHPPPPRRRDRTTPSTSAINEYELPGQLLLRLPDQGQPAAARRRGDPRLRQAVRLRPGGRLASPSCSPCWR